MRKIIFTTLFFLFSAGSVFAFSGCVDTPGYESTCSDSGMYQQLQEMKEEQERIVERIIAEQEKIKIGENAAIAGTNTQEVIELREIVKELHLQIIKVIDLILDILLSS